MTWMAVAVGGSALIGAGASYFGSKKQADAAKDAAGLSMEQYRQLRADQMPYMQGGYSALGRLNTLLGLNPRARPAAANDGQMTIPRRVGGGYAPTPGGGVSQRIPYAQGQPAIPQKQSLGRLLALRAQNGDTQAAEILNRMAG